MLIRDVIYECTLTCNVQTYKMCHVDAFASLLFHDGQDLHLVPVVIVPLGDKLNKNKEIFKPGCRPVLFQLLRPQQEPNSQSKFFDFYVTFEPPKFGCEGLIE